MTHKFATSRIDHSSPLIAVAVHHGHAVRPEVAGYLALDESVRRREEDPFTGRWTIAAPNRIVVHRSRFEVDLNRPRSHAVYRTPADAWGLAVWEPQLPPPVVERSLALYDRFYEHLRRMIESLLERHPCVVVLDLHSYNHRRQGPDSPPEDPLGNPEVNVGTGTMDRQRYAPLVERFCSELLRWPYLDRRLDVRENVRFQGGELPRWVHQTFPRQACALAIEVKKFFMDEWTGRADRRQVAEVGAALKSAAGGLIEVLDFQARTPAGGNS